MVNSVTVEELLSQIPESDTDEYTRLSYQAGGLINKPENIKAKIAFLKFLQKNEIVIYPGNKVAEFMDELCKKINGPWHKQMFRTSKLVSWSWRYATRKDAGDHSWVYEEAIPLHAVRKMAVLREKYGTSVKFQITQMFEVVKPDPFLRVKYDNKFYVIDHWDEPDFKLLGE